MKHFNKKFLSTVFVGFFLLGCAGPDLKIEPLALTSNPADQIEQTESKINEAKKQGIAELAPVWFKKADRSFSEANRQFSKGGEVASILENLALSRAQLEKAKEYAAVARTTLEPTIEARNKAIEAGANSKTKGFADAEAEFQELTEAIESDHLRYAENNRDEVITLFHTAEKEAIRDGLLQTARNNLKTAADLDADDYVPETYAQVEAKIKNASEFIWEHPYDKEKNEALSASSTFDTARLVALAQEAKAVEDRSPEQNVLWLESRLDRISKGLVHQDNRDKRFDVQIARIENAAVSSDQLESRVSEFERVHAQEERTISKLEAEKLWNEKFDQVRAMFSEENAEVYRDGNRMIIRLKALDFPVGQAILVTSNYKLLEKVKGALGTFDHAKVIVEGHTDATGSAKINKQLSQERAEAVTEYFLTHSDLPKDSFEAKGLGFEKPLASNKTKKGRALNRRVDVVLVAPPVIAE